MKVVIILVAIFSPFIGWAFEEDNQCFFSDKNQNQKIVFQSVSLLDGGEIEADRLCSRYERAKFNMKDDASVRKGEFFIQIRPSKENKGFVQLTFGLSCTFSWNELEYGYMATVGRDLGKKEWRKYPRGPKKRPHSGSRGLDLFQGSAAFDENSCTLKSGEIAGDEVTSLFGVLSSIKLEIMADNAHAFQLTISDEKGEEIVSQEWTN